MASLDLELNKKIYVIKAGSNTQYVSSVEKLDGDEITIADPIFHSSSMKASVGDRLTVRVPLETHLIEFSTEIVRKTVDNIIFYVIRRPESFRRIQLRKDVRLNLTTDVLYSRLPCSPKGPQYKKALMLDISAGGVRISAPEPLKEGEQILLKFDLPIRNTVQTFQLESVVVRANTFYDHTPPVHQAGLKYTNITESQKDNIYNYIFSKMSEMRRQGKA
ncbi:MAG: flagellar brake protein [Bacillota bacterium]